MAVIVTVFESADLTAPETKTETMPLRTLSKVLPAPPLVVEPAPEIYLQTVHSLYVGAVLPTHGRHYPIK